MTLENILKNILKYGIFIVPFIPLVFTPEYFKDVQLFFPFITGKNFLFRILIEILAGLYIVLAINDSSYRPKRSHILNALALFLLVLIFSTIFSVNPYKSFWSNFERMEGLITHLHLFMYFVIITSFLNTKELWKKFFQISIGVSIVVGLYGLLQLAGFFTIHQGGVRLDSTFGNASYLGIYMLFHIFITAIFFFGETENKIKKSIYGAIILFQTFILYNTATRGVVLGLLGGIILSSIIVTIKNTGLARKIGIGLIALILLITFAFSLVDDMNFVKESELLSRFSNLSFSSIGEEPRLIIWSMSLKGFLERPILGWGLGNYEIVFNKYYNPSLYDQEQWFDRSHNVILDWLVSTGIIGLLSYLFIYVTVLYYLIRKNVNIPPITQALLIGLISAYFFQNLFIFDNITSYILFFSILGFVHFNSTYDSKSVFEKIRIKINVFDFFHNKPLKTHLVTISVIVIFVVYVLNVPQFIGNMALVRAIKPYGDISINIDLFEKAVAKKKLGYVEVGEQLVRLTPQFVNDNISDEIKSRFIDITDDTLTNIIRDNPLNARQKLFYGMFLSRTGRYNEALVYLEDALSLSPKKQQIMFEVANTRHQIGDTDMALSILKEAYELDKNFESAVINYAIIAMASDNFLLAEKILIERFGTIVIMNEKIIGVYYQLGRHDLVLAIRKMYVEENPNNAQYWSLLSSAYFDIGDKNKAIEAMEKAIELNPSFSDQGNYIINEIKEGRSP